MICSISCKYEKIIKRMHIAKIRFCTFACETCIDYRMCKNKHLTFVDLGTCDLIFLPFFAFTNIGCNGLQAEHLISPLLVPFLHSCDIFFNLVSSIGVSAIKQTFLSFYIASDASDSFPPKKIQLV